MAVETKQETFSDVMNALFKEYPDQPVFAEVSKLFVRERRAYRIHQRLRHLIDAKLKAYNETRFALFESKLAEKGLGWCTLHEAAVLLDDLRFFYIQEPNEDSAIHVACTICRRQWHDRLALRPVVKDFDAYPVEMQGGIFCSSRDGSTFGDWWEAEKPHLTSNLADVWGVPPEISVSGFRERILYVRDIKKEE